MKISGQNNGQNNAVNTVCLSEAIPIIPHPTPAKYI